MRALFRILAIFPILAVVASLASFVMLGVEPAAVAASAAGPAVAIVAPDGAARATVRVEIADSQGKREFGLMYREHLDEDAGMIFIFANPSHLSFWMKHTEIPLDMIFAGADRKIVGIVENATPLSENSLGPDGDSQYVLEVNGGFCKRHGVKARDSLKFEGFVPKSLD
jgi:hypothetical protein